MGLLLEHHQLVEGFPAVDLSAGANNGDYVSLKNYKHVSIVFASGIGTAGQDPTVVVQQAQDVAGTGVKALNINASKVFKKQAPTSLASTGQWSDASAGVTANSWTDAEAAEQSLLLVIEFDADELDVDNGFDCIRATIADVGANAQPGYLLYILSEPRYASRPTQMPSAIA
jgi:hypothetical protein